MKEWLQRGDIIFLDKGMMIRTRIPKKIYEPDSFFSKEYVSAIIEIGKVYKSPPIDKLYFIKKLQKHFCELELEDIEMLADIMYKKCTKSYKIEELDTSKYIGNYIVTSAGNKDKEDSVYNVVCFKQDDPSIRVEFFQEDLLYYKNCIPNIKAIYHIEM